VIERLEFQRGDVWYARHFRGLVTFLVGHSKAGKSTALEALLYPLGLLTATVMPEVRSCAYVRLVFRIAGTRWQATRSGSNPRARVSLKNLDDQDEIEHLLPVTSTKPGETTAGAFVQDLLGLPAAVRGATRVGLDEGAADQREQQIAAARAKVERLRLRLRTLEQAALAAAAEAAKADAAAADALAARDAYDEGQLQPAHKAAQQAEKEAHGLSRDVAQLKERLDSADYISAQEKAIQTAKEQMEAAQAARDAAVTAHDVRRKEVTAHWSEFFLARLQQINPDVETAFIDPSDFTTRVKERHAADKTFAESSVAGSPKVATNVALLLALRDLGRVDPAVRVPPLMIIDSPLAGLGAQGLDHATGLRLIDTLIAIANDASPDGYACQVIAATNDPLPRPYPGVREISIDTDNRFFDHAPRRDQNKYRMPDQDRTGWTSPSSHTATRPR
jgi:hypothetical protein